MIATTRGSLRTMSRGPGEDGLFHIALLHSVLLAITASLVTSHSVQDTIRHGHFFILTLPMLRLYEFGTERQNVLHIFINDRV